jgi:hypothetical protein
MRFLLNRMGCAVIAAAPAFASAMRKALIFSAIWPGLLIATMCQLKRLMAR